MSNFSGFYNETFVEFLYLENAITRRHVFLIQKYALIH